MSGGAGGSGSRGLVKPGAAAARGDAAQRLFAIDWSALTGLGPLVCASASRVLAGESAERTLDRLLRAHREFSAAQRTAVVEALFGIALWRRRLAAYLGLPWSDEQATERLPVHAPALFCSLLRDLGGLDEARARDLSGCGPAPAKTELRSPAELHSLPDWLWSLLCAELSSENDLEAHALAAALSLPGPIFLRANRLRTTRERLREALAAEGIASEPCAFAPDGVRVTTPRPNLYGSQAFRAGLFEAQDEGSQLLGALVEAQPGERVLDFCAGAGGKSLQLAAAVGAGGRVFCADPERARLERLRLRADRAGASCVEILERVPAELLADRVLVDAPCSELSALRRGPDARFRIDRAALATLPGLQLEILGAAARHVRPGGRLVYATCTLRCAENEAVAEAFERAQRGFARIRPCAAGPNLLPESFFRDRFFQSLPHRHGTDGFFAAAWTRS